MDTPIEQRARRLARKNNMKVRKDRLSGYYITHTNDEIIICVDSVSELLQFFQQPGMKA